MDLGIRGKVAVVAGASQGLGRGVAEALADEGVSLVVNARRSDKLTEAAAALVERGVQVLAFAGDATSPDLPGELVAAAVEHFGRLDIVVTNSGGPPPARALEIDDEQIRAAIESNLLTHVRFVRAALPHLRATGWGRICAIASSSVIQPIPELALSNLARTGLRAWTKSAAQDLRGSGVTLNLIAPGLHLTERMRELSGAMVRRADDPVDGMGDPADFGRVVAFICSQHAGFINGSTLLIDGGASLAL